MKCKKCNSENRAAASYCQNCGSKFTKYEQDKAKSKTVEGIFVRALEAVDKLKSILDLSIITDTIWFKILSVFVVLGIGVYFCFQNGNHIRLLESTSYQINYNKNLEEYYLLVDQNETKLNLYIPYRNQDIVIKHMLDESQLDSKVYQDGSDIILTSNQEKDYYLIIGKNLRRKQEVLKVYIYKRELKQDEVK